MNRTTRTLAAALLAALASVTATARSPKTTEDINILAVNEQITTLITAPEPVKFVDISTDKVAGDRPMDNTVRIKAKDSVHRDGEHLAVITIVTERYRVQYNLVYTSRIDLAATDKTVSHDELTQYSNPSVAMSTEDMYRFAHKVWMSPAKFRNVSTKRNRMKMRLNNIYAVGEYFFIDFSVDNRTNIRFDIDQIRVKLADKKVSKATNSQTIELTPQIMLWHTNAFKRGYRNVIVLRKMTFPNDKVLTIEMSERQISGRTISLNIDYEDVLAADNFSNELQQED